MYGNWDVVAGKYFDLHPAQIVEPGLVSQDLRKFSGHVEIICSIDWGYQPSAACCLWHAVFPDHRVVTFKELYTKEMVFEDFVKEIAEESKDMEVSVICLPHDMFRHGDRYRDDSGKVIGEMKSDVFEYYGLPTVGVESGKGKVEMRYDKIHSACSLQHEDGVYKFRISKACENLLDEMDHAVHDDVDPVKLKGSDHAIDAYGHFLVYYSDDIEPLGFESLTVDNRSYLQKLLDDDEERLEQEEEEELAIQVDSIFDVW